MLAGARPFDGDDITDLIVGIVSREPAWQALPSGIPTGIRRLLRRCLEKDPKKRLDSAAALRIEIDDATSGSGSAVSESERLAPVAHTPTAGRSARRPVFVVAALSALVGAALGAVLVWPMAQRTVAPTGGLARTLISVAPADILQTDANDPRLGEGRPARTAFALSPDGRTIVFNAVAAGRQQLFVRRLDQLEATPIAGTETGHSPFFSPMASGSAFRRDRLS